MSGLELIHKATNRELKEGSIITAKSNYCGFNFVTHYEYREVYDNIFDFVDIDDYDNTLEASDLLYCSFNVMDRKDFEKEYRINL